MKLSRPKSMKRWKSTNAYRGEGCEQWYHELHRLLESNGGYCLRQHLFRQSKRNERDARTRIVRNELAQSSVHETLAHFG